jgi:branched-chain amino acid transport system permease protein
MTMVGGIGSFLGPVLGAAIIQIIEELTTRFTEQVELVVGLILILVIVFVPMGGVGLLKMLRQQWLARSAFKAGLEKAS